MFLASFHHSIFCILFIKLGQFVLDDFKIIRFLPSKNVSNESVQCLKSFLLVPLYQINVLSTFDAGGNGRKPNPTKKTLKLQ